MRIAEHRDPVRRHANDLVDGFHEALRSLVRQAVNQVDVDRIKTERAAKVQQTLRHVVRLDPVHSLLDQRIEILDAHRDPVETEPPQGPDLLFRRDARIHFYSNFRIRRELEALPGVQEQILELGRAHVRGGSTAPMKLNHRARAVEARSDLADFPLELLEIGMADPVLLADDHVAAAEEAQALAEREMHVQRKRARRAGVVGFRQD